MSRQLKILLIEDQPADAELCERELRRAGLTFETRRVFTREALENALDSFSPDLILADFNMPTDIDGFVGLEIVRQRAPDTPFIYVSGTIGEERAVEALKSGATDYVLKDKLQRLGPVAKRALLEAADRRTRLDIQHALQQSEARFRSFMHYLPGRASIRDAAGRYTYVNETWAAAFGLKPEQVIGQSFDHLGDAARSGELRSVHQRVLSSQMPVTRVFQTGGSESARWLVATAIRTRQPTYENDIRAQSGSGGERRQEAVRRGYRSVIALPLTTEGAVTGVFSLFAKELNFFDESEVELLTELAGNISFALQSISRQEKLDYLSYYDALTGLPNRQLFMDRLGQQMRSRGSEPRMVALILFDIERFRNVNETLGRRGGDEVLRQVAQRMDNAFGNKDYLSRIAADCFGVIVRGVRDAGATAQIIEKQVLGSFRAPFVVDDRELRVSAKASVALYPADGVDADALFRNAEAALKKAKIAGEHFLFYAADMNARAAEALSLETRLRRAVEAEHFVLHYQPKIDLASGRVSGLEALIRWQDPDTGLVAPGLFIPLLEETGLILEVGKWVIDQAFRDHHELTARGCTVPRIAVNVSAIQLQQRDFVDTVTDSVRRTGNSPGMLEIEITESLLVKDMEGSIRKLAELRELGIHIAMDDFGTGYSSLSSITRLPLNVLKVDRTFVNGMAKNAQDMAIVTTVIALAQALDLRVVAEGVETAEQSRLLKLLRCHEAQGYFFSKPLPKGEIEGFLAAQI